MMYDSLSLVGGGGIAVTSSALKDTANGHRSSMSYLSVGERGERGEVCANGNGGGCDGASTGSDSLSAGQTSDETKRQQRSPLLSPNMELERARAKIRLLQKEVSQIPSRPCEIFFDSVISVCLGCTRLCFICKLRNF